jgi:DNA-3-methyladenine glycosylase I
MSDTELEDILLDVGIVRNKLKVYSVRKNAKVAQGIIRQYGSIYQYLCTYTGSQVRVNRPIDMEHISTRSDISDSISRDLKKRGMSFVGTTIIYAYLQAIGMVDDHIQECWLAI